MYQIRLVYELTGKKDLMGRYIIHVSSPDDPSGHPDPAFWTWIPTGYTCEAIPSPDFPGTMEWSDVRDEEFNLIAYTRSGFIEFLRDKTCNECNNGIEPFEADL